MSEALKKGEVKTWIIEYRWVIGDESWNHWRRYGRLFDDPSNAKGFCEARRKQDADSEDGNLFEYRAAPVAMRVLSAARKATPRKAGKKGKSHGKKK